MDQIDVEARVAKAESLFRQGYNCAQSVSGAYADVYGVPLALMLRMSASFGAGIGRMRHVCGTASGMFLLAGLETGCTNPEDAGGKGANYKVVQELAGRFKQVHGSMICAELLGLDPKTLEPVPVPESRTEEYYKKRPCVETVKNAARIYGEYLKGLCVP